ncbi:MAG: hypothetical protein ACP5MB_04340 [bacterium]
MSKYSNKKALISILVVMVMVLSAFVVISGSASATASGTVTYNPTTYGLSSNGYPLETVAFVSGGTFSSGATIYFYLSSNDSYTGLLWPYAIGNTTLTAASPTTLNQAVTFFPNGNIITGIGSYTPAPKIKAGQYYILATNAAPPLLASEIATLSWAFPASVSTFVPETATLHILTTGHVSALGANALTVGSTAIAYGTGWDSGASVNIYLNYPGGPLLATASANSFGIFETTFTVPQLAGTVEVNEFNSPTTVTSVHVPYFVVAQEMNSYSSTTYPQGGITNSSKMDIAPSITVSPIDISGAAGATLTVTGTGFPAGATIPASTATVPSYNIQVYIYTDLSTPLSVTLYYSAINVSATGQFTDTITIMNALLPFGTGPFGISMKFADRSPYATTITDEFFPAFYVSAPNTQALGFFFVAKPDPVTGLYYPMNPLAAAVFDFPADVQVSIYIGSTLVGNITTDTNGFGALSSAIPAMPAGTYNVVAVDHSMNLVSAPTIGAKTLTVSPFYMVTDNMSNKLAFSKTNEYVPQTGTIIVSAYGLSPGTVYYATDGNYASYGSLAAYGNVFALGLVTGVMVGTENAAMTGVLPAANGTIIFAYTPYYGYYGVTTGTPANVQLYASPLVPPSKSTAVPPFEGVTFGYNDIGAPQITISQNVISPGETGITVSVANLIPGGSAAPFTFYPGTSDYYNVYIGTSEIVSSVVPITSLFQSSSSGSIYVVFSVPAMVNGVYNVSVVYAGQPVSSALPPESSALVVVSTPGTSATSGTMVTVPIMSAGQFNGYLIAGFGFLPQISPDLTVYGSSGVLYGVGGSMGKAVPEQTGKYGAFFDTSTLSLSTVEAQVAGTYELVLSEPFGTTTYEFYASYTVVPVLVFSSMGFYSGPVFYDWTNNVVTITATGLSPGTYYDLYFGSQFIGTYEYLANGGFMPSTFTVPIVPVGMYYVNLTYTGTHTVVVSEPFVVWYNGVIFNPSNGAFPGQYVQFWIPAGDILSYAVPSTASGVVASYDVQIFLNGTPFETVPVSLVTNPNSTYYGYYAGSFQMPNNWPNTVYQVGLEPMEKVSFNNIETVTQSGVANATLTASNEAANWGYAQLTNGGEVSDGSALITVSNIETTPNLGMNFTLSDVNSLTITYASSYVGTSNTYVNFTASDYSGVTFGFEVANSATTPVEVPVMEISSTAGSTIYDAVVSSITTSTGSTTETVTFSLITVSEPTTAFEDIWYVSGAVFTGSGTTGTITSGSPSEYFAPSSSLAVTTGANWDPASAAFTTITISESGTYYLALGSTHYYDLIVSPYTPTPAVGITEISGTDYAYFTGYTISTTFTLLMDDSAPFGTLAFPVYPALTTVTLTEPAGTTLTNYPIYNAASPSSSAGVSEVYTASYNVWVTLPNGTTETGVLAYSSSSTSPSANEATLTGNYVLGVYGYEDISRNAYVLSLTDIAVGMTSLSSAQYNEPVYYLTFLSLGATPATTPATEPGSGYYTTAYAQLYVYASSSTTPASVALSYLVSPGSGTVGPVWSDPSTYPGELTYTLTATYYNFPQFKQTYDGAPTFLGWNDSITFSIYATSQPSNGFALNIPNGYVSGTYFSAGAFYSYSWSWYWYSLSNATLSVLMNYPVAFIGGPYNTYIQMTVNGVGLYPVKTAPGYYINVSYYKVTFVNNNFNVIVNFTLQGSGPIGTYSMEVTSLNLDHANFTLEPSNDGYGSSFVNGTFTSQITQLTYETNVTVSPVLYETYALVQGNGAYIMGISSGQIAEIVAAVNSAVTTSMQVPLSELNASIVAINNASAVIKSAVGTMTASLSAINATVTGIANGMATVKSDLGTVQTSLASINASILGVENNIVLLNTSIGQVKTTLNAIGATLVSMNNTVMTLSTDAGTMMASISALNATIQGIANNVVILKTDAGTVMASLSAMNATLMSMSGNVATIQTSLGTITTSLSSLNAQVASINGTVLTLSTKLGNVQASLNSINGTVTSTASSVSSLVGSAATIQTDLGTISGTVTSVSNGVATIQTSLGALQTNVSAIKTTTANTASSVSSTLGWEIGALVLVIITLVLVLIVIMQVSKISKQFKPKEEKKTPEEKTEEKKEGQ